jgi:serine/threonine protein kinase
MATVLGPSAEPIPGYRLIERLGRGGFGEVWKAVAPGGLHKAIKFVYGDLSAAGEGEPAEQERKSLERIKSIRHPYILSLERIEEVDGQLLIVMELADRNLWDRFRECRGLNLPGIPRDELLNYMTETAEALDLMNIQYQLQHLDIKPQNLFLVYNHIKVADFGLVKELRGEVSKMTGGVTPVYAAPETFNGFVSQQCDQYSLAIVYQELLTGQRPFNGTSAYQLLSQHVSKMPDLSSLPERDRAAIGRALSKKPDERFECCSDLVHALKISVSDKPAPKKPAPVDIVEPEHDDESSSDSSSHIESQDAGHVVHDRERQNTTRLRRKRAAPETQAAPRPDEDTPREQPEALSIPMDEVPSGSSATAECTFTPSSPILMPAVIIGIGGMGIQVLRCLKRAMAAQTHGAALPHLRFLAVDCDATSLRELTTDTQHPFQTHEVFHASLNRPSHYIKSDAGGGVINWLGSQTLYKLPRTPTAAEVRGFGRLAFCDHAPAIARQLKASIDECRQPKALEDANLATGLGIRSEQVRVYIIAGLSGGTGSGMFLDMAYLARHILREAGLTMADVIGMFLLPPTSRSGAISQAVINAQAALVELNHYSDTRTSYECRINSKFNISTDNHRPFARCCVLPLSDAPDGSAITRSAGQAAAIITRELLSSIGPAADQERANGSDFSPTTGLTVQSAATYQLIWPAEELNKRVARGLAQSLVQAWTAKEIAAPKDAISKWLDEQWDIRALAPERIAERFHQAAITTLGKTPTDFVEGLIAPLSAMENQSETADSDLAKSVLESIVEFLGPATGFKVEGPPPTLPALFDKTTPDIIRQCDQHLAELAVHFVEQPGFRIGSAETAIRLLGERARASLSSYEALAASLSKEASSLFRELLTAVGMVKKTGGMGEKIMRTGRQKQQAQDICVMVRDFGKKQYQAILAKELSAVYRGLIGSVPELLHDVHHCRLRLVEVEKALAAPAGTGNEAEADLGPGRYLLAATAGSLNDAAQGVIAEIPRAERDELDRAVQERVKKLFRSLVNFCLDAGPRVEMLVEALEAAATEFVAGYSDKRSSIDVFLNVYQGDGGSTALREAFAASYPVLAGQPNRNEAVTTFISAPNNDAGQSFREEVKLALMGEPILLTESADEILFYRELRSLEIRKLPHFSKENRAAYQEAVAKADRPPHTRMDITWYTVK